MEIYVYDNLEQQLGPFDEQTVRSMVLSKQLTETSYGWHEGLSEWQPLNTFLKFNQPPPPPPAPQKTQISSKSPSIVTTYSPNKLTRADECLLNLYDTSKDSYTFLNITENKTYGKNHGRNQMILSVLGGVLGASIGVGGLIGGGLASIGSVNEKSATKDMEEISTFADLVGMNVVAGANLIAGMNADNLEFDEIVQRCDAIHKKMYDIRKYSGNMVFDKFQTVARIFIAFSSHAKARDFKTNHASKCPHWAFMKKILTQAFIVDMEDRDVTCYNALNFSLFKMSQKQKDALTKNRTT